MSREKHFLWEEFLLPGDWKEAPFVLGLILVVSVFNLFVDASVNCFMGGNILGGVLCGALAVLPWQAIYFLVRVLRRDRVRDWIDKGTVDFEKSTTQG